MIPGSVPPWRALCGESAPAAASAALTRPARSLPRALVFRGPVVVSGFRAMVVVVFHFRQSQKRGARSLSFRLIVSEHFRGRNALGCARRRTSKLVGRAATQLNANSKSSPSRWGCFVKRFSALRAESRSYSLPLQHIACRLPIRLNRRSPIFRNSSPTLSVALRACPRAALLSLRSIC